MNLQYIIIGILVLGALFFLGNKLRNSFKGDCSRGCDCSDKIKKKNKV
ncbi:MAG: FeoB-associated Cys-rich membrane protein [Flavobacteriales bacterium]